MDAIGTTTSSKLVQREINMSKGLPENESDHPMKSHSSPNNQMNSSESEEDEDGPPPPPAGRPGNLRMWMNLTGRLTNEEVTYIRQRFPQLDVCNLFESAKEEAMLRLRANKNY